jgi:methylmalonyl-CoA/ethylmalonyl-CoA epimerase
MTPPSCSWFGPSAIFHHVGIAVSSDVIGQCDLEAFADPKQRVTVAFVECSGCCIELVAPLTESSPVSGALKKGQKLLHLCFEVGDLEEAFSVASRCGFRVLARPVPAVAFDGRRIGWVYHVNYGLFELLEGSKSVCSNSDL